MPHDQFTDFKTSEVSERSAVRASQDRFIRGSSSSSFLALSPDPSLTECILPSSAPTLRRTRKRAMVDLVGIEPNPGPKNQKKPQASKNLSKQAQRTIQAKPKTVVRTVAPKPVISTGESVGRSIGGFLGKAASSVLGSIFGMGDYKVNYNTLSGIGGPPQFSNNGTNRSTVVTHREYVQDVTGTTSFSINSFPITPSNSTLFPWLSSVADNYEEYRIHGMIFEFKTTSGMSVSSTNTALGTVIMSTQYNPNDPQFNNKITMENYEFATSGGPFENFLHPVECKPALTVAPQLYVAQSTSSGAVVDLRLTNFGTFSIATVGMQASNVVGELWVSYQVELLKPRISSFPTLVGLGQIHYAGSGSFTQNSSSGSLGSAAGTVTQVNAPTSVLNSNPLFPASVVNRTPSDTSGVTQVTFCYGAGFINGIEFPLSWTGHEITLGFGWALTTGTGQGVIGFHSGITDGSITGVLANGPSGACSTHTFRLVAANLAAGATNFVCTFTTPAAASVTGCDLFMSICD